MSRDQVIYWVKGNANFKEPLCQERHWALYTLTIVSHPTTHTFLTTMAVKVARLLFFLGGLLLFCFLIHWKIGSIFHLTNSLSMSNNPFLEDSRKPKRPLVIDRSIRDASLRRNFSIDLVSDCELILWKYVWKSSVKVLDSTSKSSEKWKVWSVGHQLTTNL